MIVEFAVQGMGRWGWGTWNIFVDVVLEFKRCGLEVQIRDASLPACPTMLSSLQNNRRFSCDHI